MYIDVEGSKKLSYAEFEEQYLNVVGKQRDSQMFCTFHAHTIDANGDGSIDLAEWRGFYECHGLHAEHAKALFDAPDGYQPRHDGLIARKSSWITNSSLPSPVKTSSRVLSSMGCLISAT